MPVIDTLRTRVGQQRLGMMAMFVAATFANFSLLRYMRTAPIKQPLVWLLPLLLIPAAIYFLVRGFHTPTVINYRNSMLISCLAGLVGIVKVFHLLG
jgi:hypothetical protein